MSGSTLHFVVVLAWALTQGAAFVRAQDGPTAESDAAALLRRLERAEARIRVLEWSGAAADPAGAGPPGIQPETDPGDGGLQPVRFNDPVIEQLRPTTAAPVTPGGSATDSVDRSTSPGVAVIRGDDATMQLVGRIHLDYWAFPDADAGAAVLEGVSGTPFDPQDRFGLRRLRFGARGEIGEQVIYQFDLEFPSPPDFEIRDVFIGVRDLPWVQDVLVGNQKRPYGLDAINSSNFNIFLERPAVVEAFNPGVRRLGIQSWDSTDDLHWNWRYGLFSGVNVQNNGGQAVGDLDQLEFAGRLARTWGWDEASDGRRYAHQALAFSIARPDGESRRNVARFGTRPQALASNLWLDTGMVAGAEWYQLLGTEQLLNLGPLQLVGEVQNVWLQREGNSDLHFWGAYGYIAYFLTGEHMAWDRATGQLARIRPSQNFGLADRVCGERGGGWGAWQVAARFSYLDITDEDVLGGVNHQGSLALVWYWNSNTRLQLDWEHGWIVDQSRLAIAGAPEAEYDAVGLRFAVDF